MPFSRAFRPGLASRPAAACAPGFSGCWRGKTVGKEVSATSWPKISSPVPIVNSKDIPLNISTTCVVLYGSGNPAFSSSLSCSWRQFPTRHRKVCKKVSRQLDQQRGFIRGCGDVPNSVTPKPVEQKQQARPPVVLANTPGSRTEKISIMERVRRNPLTGFFEGASNVFRADELGVEISVIALPALLALAADPLASLVDTGFIGQIGPVELAAVGVSISIFNLVSKMFNLPLLNITTSFVAEDEASVRDAELKSSVLDPILERRGSVSLQDNAKEELLERMDVYEPKNTKPLLPSVSSALVLGTALGLMEAVVMTLGAGPILTIMGVGVESPMRIPAVQYLTLRAIGAPAVVVALAIQGVFRGFKDTKTPLFAMVLGNVINIVLDPILMFALKFGVSGAAVATVLSQYVIALVLLWTLNKRVSLLPPRLGDLRFNKFFKSGGLLLGRTLAILLTMTLATSMAARQGPIPMAAHQICMQVWLAASLLSDSLALAGQAIIASAFTKGDYRQVKEAAFRVLQMGLALGFMMAMILGVGAGWFTKLFTKDAGVLEAMALIIPFVVATQPINSLAFVFDGLHYGVTDFGYAASSMMVVAIPSCMVLLLAAPVFHLPGVWIGLTVIMALRMFAGFLRIGTCTGPWKFFLQDTDEILQGDIDLEENPRYLYGVGEIIMELVTLVQFLCTIIFFPHSDCTPEIIPEYRYRCWIRRSRPNNGGQIFAPEGLGRYHQLKGTHR